MVTDIEALVHRRGVRWRTHRRQVCRGNLFDVRLDGWSRRRRLTICLIWHLFHYVGLDGGRGRLRNLRPGRGRTSGSSSAASRLCLLNYIWHRMIQPNGLFGAGMLQLVYLPHGLDCRRLDIGPIAQLSRTVEPNFENLFNQFIKST